MRVPRGRGEKKRSGLTLADVPAQMAEAVPRVEREGRGEDDLARVLDALGEARD